MDSNPNAVFLAYFGTVSVVYWYGWVAGNMLFIDIPIVMFCINPDIRTFPRWWTPGGNPWVVFRLLPSPSLNTQVPAFFASSFPCSHWNRLLRRDSDAMQLVFEFLPLSVGGICQRVANHDNNLFNAFAFIN